MSHYILKRMLLMIPTLFFIVLINFMIAQIAPGGPFEQAIQQIQNGSSIIKKKYPAHQRDEV